MLPVGDYAHVQNFNHNQGFTRHKKQMLNRTALCVRTGAHEQLRGIMENTSSLTPFLLHETATQRFVQRG